MTIVDAGAGSPLVLIPGVQGRWEWMRPAVDALAAHMRVLTFSLADEPTAHARFDPHDGIGSYVEQVREALDEAGIERAAICGVSFGGLVAAAFAARYPARTTSLVLVSALPPSWTPDSRIRFFLRAPRLLSPLFVAGSVRLFPEIAAASGGVGPGLRPAIRHGWNALTHLFSPSRMAGRARMVAGLDLTGLAQCDQPTLVITGEPALERVVPVASTLEYARLCPQARVVTLGRTGHLGSITRPDAFAALVVPFVQQAANAAPPLRRRVG